MSYIGNTATTQSFTSGTDYFSGNGSTTAFTLSRSVASANDIVAVIENVVQQPNTAYTVNGTTITFTSAPGAGSNNIYVRYISTNVQTLAPIQNSVGYSTLNTDLQTRISIGYKNRIQNGAMQIDQRNIGTTPIYFYRDNGSQNTIYFGPDRFGINNYNNCSQDITAAIVNDAPAGQGFTKSFKATVGTGAATQSTNRRNLAQYPEGLLLADLQWGTVYAKQITMSFWVKSSLTGTFGFAINGNGTAAYATTYSINASNTWEYKTITIPGPTIGTWATDNTAWGYLQWDLGQGSAIRATPAQLNAWAAADYRGLTTGVKLAETTGATWQITGIQMEIGSTATAYDFRQYADELRICQRYYQVINANGLLTVSGGSNVTNGTLYYPVTMRASPTISGDTLNRMTNFGFTDYSGSFTFSSNYATPNLASVKYTAASSSPWGSTIGVPLAMNDNTGAAKYLYVSAEL